MYKMLALWRAVACTISRILKSPWFSFEFFPCKYIVKWSQINYIILSNVKYGVLYRVIWFKYVNYKAILIVNGISIKARPWKCSDLFFLAVSSHVGIAKCKYWILQATMLFCVLSLHSGLCKINGTTKLTVCLNGYVFTAKTNLRFPPVMFGIFLLAHHVTTCWLAFRARHQA